MQAPSLPNFTQDQSFRDNPNAPAIRFIRKNGRVIPIVQRQKKPSLSPVVEGRLNEMQTEIKVAEKGVRGVAHDKLTGNYRNFKTISTFPSWYQKQRFKNRGEFHQVMQKREGKKFDGVAEQAITDLKDGYQTSFGFVPPNREFRVKTLQTFDNRGVIFRKIDGKIRPLRINKPERKKMDLDEVPF